MTIQNIEQKLKHLSESELKQLLAAIVWEMAIEDIAEVLQNELPKDSGGRATLIYQLQK